MIDSTGVEIAVLGPVELRVAGRVLPLDGPRMRTLVALLGLRAGDPVPVWRIMEALWEGDPPTRARNQVQVYVSRLRRSLAAVGWHRAVRTQGGGYLLDVDPDRVDALRFGRLVAEAGRVAAPDRDGIARTLLEQALALWRGEALCDIVTSRLEAEASALEETRSRALELRIDLDLRHGRYADLIPELRGLVTRRPLHEGFRHRLMEALARVGRAAQAMEVFREGCRLLREELAVDPGDELRDLALAIGEGRISGPVPSLSGGCSLPPAVRGFVGRDAAEKELRHCLELTGAPPVGVVTGAAGVGKSTLALRVAHGVRDRYPDGQVYIDLRGCRQDPTHPAEAAALLLRSMGVPGQVVPPDATERLMLYRSTVAGRRMLILLDDAADEHQVRPLLPGTGGSAVLVTSRSRLIGLDDAHRIELGMLSRAESVRLLRTVAGAHRATDLPDPSGPEPAGRATATAVHLPAPAADLIAELCGDHPLAVRVAAARLAERSHLTPARLIHELADERSRLDALRAGDLEVRATLANSWAGQPEPLRRALRLLSLTDVPDLPLWAVACVLDVPLVGARRAVDLLTDARLLIATLTEDGEARYRLQDLVRLFCRERAGAEEPAATSGAVLDRLAGGYLTAIEAADRALTVGLIPTRPLAAQRRAIPDEQLLVVRADPTGWFTRELPALVTLVRECAGAGRVGTAGALAAGMAHFLEKGNYFDQWWDTHHRVLEAARQADAATPVAMVMARNLGELHTVRDEWPQAIAHFTETLHLAGQLDDLTYRTAAMIGLGYLHRLTGRYDSSLRYYAEAVEAARRDGNRNGELHATLGQGTVWFEQGRYDLALARYRDCARDCRGAGYHAGEAQALRGLGLVHLERGESTEAVAVLRRARAISADLGDQLIVAYAGQLLAYAYVVAGEPASAEALLDDAERVFTGAGSRFGQAMALVTRAVVRLREDRPEPARELLERAGLLWERLRMPYWHRRTLELLAEAGRAADAGPPAG